MTEGPHSTKLPQSWDIGSDQSDVPAYFLNLFPDSFCGFCLLLLLPVRCRCCDLLICICIRAFLLTAVFISASEASRDKCVCVCVLCEGSFVSLRFAEDPNAGSELHHLLFCRVSIRNASLSPMVYTIV